MTTTTTCHRGQPLRLAEGTELLGEYRSSGYQVPQHLLRRHDGQVLQVSQLVYLVAAALERGDGDVQRVADEVSRELGTEVSADNVAYLVENRLRPSGLVASEEPPAALTRANPLLGLRLRVGLVPERLHRRLTVALMPLFSRWVVAGAIVALVAMDVWLLGFHRGEVAAAAGQLIDQPQLLLLVSALTIASAAFHELGHATAARCGGAVPGALGVGLYLVWPVFYTDVTDAYRLDRRGRLRTDLGGVYFNVVFTLAVAGAYLATGYRPLIAFLLIAQLETLQQFLPFVRLDGYYVVSDLVGVPNLFAYFQPVLVRLTPGGDASRRQWAKARLATLKPFARRVITAWVCLTAPILLFNVVLFAVLAPGLGGAVWTSAQAQFADIARAHDEGQLAGVLSGALGVLLLATPVVGTVYLVAKAVERLARGALRWWRRKPALTGAGVVALALVLTLQIALVWPDAFRSAAQHARAAISTPVATGEAEPRDAAPEPGAQPPAAPAVGDTGRRDNVPVAADTTSTPPFSESREPAVDPAPETGSPVVAADRGTDAVATDPGADAVAAVAPIVPGCGQATSGAATADTARRPWLEELGCYAQAGGAGG